MKAIKTTAVLGLLFILAACRHDSQQKWYDMGYIEGRFNACNNIPTPPRPSGFFKLEDAFERWYGMGYSDGQNAPCLHGAGSPRD